MNESRHRTELSESARALLNKVAGSGTLRSVEPLQSLWGGQGSVLQLHLNDPHNQSLVLKHIVPDASASHPRGWNSSASYVRKLKSYEVESRWYEHFAQRCHARCKVPRLKGLSVTDTERLILLEDLSIDYPATPPALSISQVSLCLRWLAEFHAQFIHEPGSGLWAEGCYWHLGTRQEEWQSMAGGPIREAAERLDELLRKTPYQTLVHGDAKLANFRFSPASLQSPQSKPHGVAAVDFQYVGRGCGMRDVAYLLGSCVDEAACERYEEPLLDSYFGQLRQALEGTLPPDEIDQLEHQWRTLYPIAWTDFYRFLLGWMPSHPKINRYTRSLAERALAMI